MSQESPLPPMTVYMIADLDGKKTGAPYMATHDFVQAKHWARQVADDPKNKVERVAILKLTVASSAGLKKERIAQPGWVECE